MNELAKQAIENLAKIKVLHKEIEDIRDATDKQTRTLRYEVYQEKIRNLEEERDREIKVIEAASQEQVGNRKATIESLQTVRNQVSQILEFLRLDTTRDLSIDDDDIHPHTGYAPHPQFKENLGYCVDDDYLKIKLFIVENGKPKNRLSVIALGKCLFPEGLLKLTHSYGLPVYTSHNYNLQVVLKDFPSVEQAKDWLNKHKSSYIITYLVGYEAVKLAYQEALKNYKVSDFQELVIARCQCGFYYTEFERTKISFHNLACPRCCNSTLTVKELKVG